MGDKLTDRSRGHALKTVGQWKVNCHLKIAAILKVEWERGGGRRRERREGWWGGCRGRGKEDGRKKNRQRKGGGSKGRKGGRGRWKRWRKRWKKEEEVDIKDVVLFLVLSAFRGRKSKRVIFGRGESRGDDQPAGDGTRMGHRTTTYIRSPLSLTLHKKTLWYFFSFSLSREEKKKKWRFLTSSSPSWPSELSR